ncbi:Crp/Fnr family transcriptional regulator [Clostridium magnum]|uniref:Anaerobic regulatory protein n=1 Tax=Clostridium magnum DSM 2767 TaxID=1121326 RepID=A0A168DVU2_9CLOT|nr:Crp/Fnr family transcriptional regulator [Clostridium magnum]KZL91531.1 anaerobic regulatory protein [Clostridium magnum DSM 2767]SHH46331.1 cAMP-binding domain of CRP or a regulatory subunit of cAMP-dependent protein kinases [Clostridium magnum DSM 2767]
MISNISLFKSFAKEELIKVFDTCKHNIKKYEKDHVIHLENYICDNIDIILEGKVSVQKIDENGSVLTINVFSDRDILGENLIFSSRSYYPMTITSMSDVTILHIQKESILDLCEKNPVFMLNLITAISDKTIILTDKINSITLKTIRQCIIDFLKYEYQIQKSDVIKLGISKKDLAERLGIQRTSLSRELNKMREDGLLEYDAKTITLKKLIF